MFTSKLWRLLMSAYIYSRNITNAIWSTEINNVIELDEGVVKINDVEIGDSREAIEEVIEILKDIAQIKRLQEGEEK